MSTQTNNQTIHLYADGGARGNPGPAACGVVLQDKTGSVLKKTGIFLGTKTNNQAEYQGLIHGLEEARKLGAKKVICFLDSNLIVNQMQGNFKVKNKGLLPLFAKALKATNSFEFISYKHIPREKNSQADKLVNVVLDKYVK